MKEGLFSPLLRKMRVQRVKSTIVNFPPPPPPPDYVNSTEMRLPILLDVGCGWNAQFLQDIEPYISSGYGIDFKAPKIETEKIKTFEYTMSDKLPFEDNSIDIVTMLAVLEHLDNPLAICREINRVLKKDGLLVITVPSKASKPVLEFLAYKLKICSEEEIRDHKEYFDKKSLINLFNKIENMQIETHKYFQLGMNNFCVIKKN